ncbi:glycosyltransferase [Oricola sp.]|uniref:glycosyltransferase n=1 Tax=Oricola sp. TaxID=1979950 RepID=UPI003BAB3E7A
MQATVPAKTVLPVSETDAEALVARIAGSRPDCVIVEGVALLTVLKRLRHALPQGTRIVVDFHNLESALLAEQDRARLPPPLRSLSGIAFAGRWRAARRADREAAMLADSIWVCSQRDRALLADIHQQAAPVHVVPNPVPDWCTTGRMEPSTMASDRPRLLFVGHLSYPPNKAAVRRLVREILPDLTRRFAHAELTVAGRAPGKRLRTLVERCPQARLAADPPDLAPLYGAADIAVMPLSEGGGSRIKVLEAMAVGCPVIASAKAVEGLDVQAGRHYLHAETSAQFVAAIETLCRDAALRERLRHGAADFVRSVHAPDRIAAAVAEALARTPAGKRDR